MEERLTSPDSKAGNSSPALKKALDPALIKTADLFTSLFPKEANYVVERSGIISLRRKAHLFSIGQRAEHFYMLLEGAVRIYKPSGDGGSEELAQYTPGDTIGDFDFACRASYDANAEATEDSVLIMFPGLGLAMEDFVSEEPLVVARILLNSIVMTTSRIKNTQKILLENLSWVNELHRRAYEDSATGLWKQTFLKDEINTILEEPSALIMLKPDRFKILVDSRGHGAGDEAMVKIAMILKKMTRRVNRGWALRFKSNETGLLIPRCPLHVAEKIVKEIANGIAGLPAVPAGDGIPSFCFSSTIAWTMWPEDGQSWEQIFDGCYALLLDTWKNGGGGKTVRLAAQSTARQKSPALPTAVTA
ncbi:MAG: cyclic nucleotide-binding domain-containing protein [Treponema sp.]|jgi:diguanylate cyclase (GGDEF)-like protein|nr:cyclic nucleotide-binding domain-containing protein [Treponema sp.]